MKLWGGAVNLSPCLAGRRGGGGKSGWNMNAWDVVLIFAVAVAVGLAARRVIADRRRGKLSCGGDCAHCMRGCEVRRK